MQLRNYQFEAVSKLRSAFEIYDAPLLVMPTGAGKTVVFCEIAKNATEKGNNVLILVHRRELIKQASQKLAAIDVEHGIIAAGFKPKHSPVQVASVQTLIRRYDRMQWCPSIIIIDEAHHAIAGSWNKILNHWGEAKRIGVTATPIRLDGKGLKDFFDVIIQGPSIPELVAENYLSPHKVFTAPLLPDLRRVRTRAGDYDIKQLDEVMNDKAIIGDAVEQYEKHAKGLQAVAFCVSIRHANVVKDSFIQAGYKAAIITGDMKMKDRDQVIDDLTTGKIQILVSIDVISEGFDLPLVSACILLRPTQSLGLYMQQVGRILRPQPGKIAIVLDHVKNTIVHGFVDTPRKWDLNSKAKRKKLGEVAPRVTVCEVCFATYRPQPICPICGYEKEIKERELEQVDGDLVELKRSTLSKITEKKPKNSRLARLQAKLNIQSIRDKARERQREQAKARTLADLQALGLKRGYSPGWAYMIYNSRKPKRR